MISIPHISDNEVFQIVREYLGGLIEASPLKDVFAAWTRRLADHARYQQERDGPCTGCTPLENPFDHLVEPPEEHPVEP